MKKIVHLLIIALAISITSCNETKSITEDGIYAKIATNKGDIFVRLEYEKTPVTVANFISLAEGKNPFVADKYKNKAFYNGLTFHRVLPNFMIQGGDPDANGSGNPGYKFTDEFHPGLKHNKPGVLSMANSGPNTNGSQFFITHLNTDWLDNVHTVFGEVVEGMDVVNAIQEQDLIETVTIIRNGEKAKKFDSVKVFNEAFEKMQEQIKIDEKNQLELEAKRAMLFQDKAAQIELLKTTGTKSKTGVIHTVVEKGTNVKPKKGKEVYIYYAGYLENGTLFDTNMESVAKLYNQYDVNKQGGYLPFPFKFGDKQGLITGFIEGIEKMNYDETIRVHIPAALAYGAQGGGPIPPNADIVFEIKMVENMPNN